jgi:glycerol-3-phosphate dehydrogenase
VSALTAEEPALARRIVRDLPYLLAEVVYAVEREMALTLADVLIRRLRIAYEVADHGRSASRVATAVLAGRLGWDKRAGSDRDRALRGGRTAHLRTVRALS